MLAFDERVAGRHLERLLVTHQVPQPTLLEIARNDLRARLAAGNERLERFQRQASLGIVATVAAKAPLDHEGRDVLLEGDGFVPGRLGDGHFDERFRTGTVDRGRQFVERFVRIVAVELGSVRDPLGDL